MTALHIACEKGLAEITSHLLITAKSQKMFCQDKGEEYSSDCERVINAKEGSEVCCFDKQ